jgi:hypothetical protein
METVVNSPDSSVAEAGQNSALVTIQNQLETKLSLSGQVSISGGSIQSYKPQAGLSAEVLERDGSREK